MADPVDLDDLAYRLGLYPESFSPVVVEVALRAVEELRVARVENVRLGRLLGNAEPFEDAWRGLNAQHSELRASVQRVRDVLDACNERIGLDDTRAAWAVYEDVRECVLRALDGVVGESPVPAEGVRYDGASLREKLSAQGIDVPWPAGESPVAEATE